MEAYFFLVILAFIWVLFASITDLKTREVPNWLSFSLISFILAYRLFFAIIHEDALFFFVGLGGAVIGFFVALGFYYGKVFAGGDAKLLIGFGALLPASSMGNMVLYSLGFLFFLFFAGSFYSMLYSSFLVINNRKVFWKEFIKFAKQQWMFLAIGLVMAVASLLIFSFSFSSKMMALFFVLIPLLFFYLKALEKSCFIKKVSASLLTEGDWLERDVQLGRRWIRKSVHGLNLEEIRMLRKFNKSVWIKEGIPFVPAFLIGLLLMVFFLAVLGSDWSGQMASLLG